MKAMWVGGVVVGMVVAAPAFALKMDMSMCGNKPLAALVKERENRLVLIEKNIVSGRVTAAQSAKAISHTTAELAALKGPEAETYRAAKCAELKRKLEHWQGGAKAEGGVVARGVPVE